MDVVVRPIHRGDVPAASLVIQGGSLSPGFEDEHDVQRYWDAVQETRRRRGDVLVAARGDEVVGVCQVMIFPHFQHTGGWCCELESVHVRSDYRSQGIGTQLLAAAEVLARREGCYRIQLTSRNVRLDAHRFYERQGFEATSQGFKKLL
ncbi:MAG TPA: GNAT family N-acetyltransferase [Acidimicrobiales bacterium]|nr:GNAT family N-acetyltransferase [Acidimicrobiales bacterium]